jgi:hypothetical protein
MHFNFLGYSTPWKISMYKRKYGGGNMKNRVDKQPGPGERKFSTRKHVEKHVDICSIGKM